MPNRLSTETSPYLLQHADNPVDWYPWGDEAFAIAQQSDKPVLLSVGYSACHWCHVMAHESFEDEATAELMNRLFVNVKLDREERPDLDRIYQLAHQLLTQRGGGWPLTMFLDAADRRPFLGGTYFPKQARYGMPAFADLLQKVADYYAAEREEIRTQTTNLVGVLGKLEPASAVAATDFTAAPLQRARDAFKQSFDSEYGGFGAAPKFPHPTTIDFLLRAWQRTASHAEPDVEALFMASLTLKRMADGGLNDHIGGGFCRYSVDRYWQIPHFEKMLYDNGPLLALYAEAALISGEAHFADTALATARWLLDEMHAVDGGFYASLDADSEGEEGRYYVWTPDEVENLLQQDYALFAALYGLDQPANFEGHWHLTRRSDIDDEHRDAIGRAQQTLLAARRQRVPPGLDDKQLAAWNALAIRGLAIAGRALQREEFIDAAVRATDFIAANLLVDGRLYASFKDGRARFPAYLDDHAFLLDAMLELLQARWDGRYLDLATQLADLLLEYFEDRERGGFYFTANDHEQLIHRPKPFADEALPSGNGVAALALQRLGFLLGESRYLDAAERTLSCGWQAIDEYPHAHVSLLKALQEYLDHPEIVIIRGSAPDIARWSDAAARVYAPGRLVFAIADDVAGLPGALADRKAVAGETVAYRCVGTHCELPVDSWEALAASLARSSAR